MLALSQAHSCRKEIVDRHAHHSNLHEYKLSFNIEVKKSDDNDNSNNIEILIISRKNVSAWKKNIGNNSKVIMLHYSNNGKSINNTFRPSIGDAYAFILNNGTLVNNSSTTKSVDVTLIHSWKQEIKESHLKEMP